MPRYDMKCNNQDCGYEFENIYRLSELDEAKCPKCRSNVRILITHSKNKDWFHPHWNDSFDLHPIFVESRNHLKSLCKRYDVTSRALGDCRNITEI